MVRTYVKKDPQVKYENQISGQKMRRLKKGTLTPETPLRRPPQTQQTPQSPQQATLRRSLQYSPGAAEGEPMEVAALAAFEERGGRFHMNP